MDNNEEEKNHAGAPSALNDWLAACHKARDIFYKNADKGIPVHWREIGPDELWEAAWNAALCNLKIQAYLVLGDTHEECRLSFKEYHNPEENSIPLYSANVELRGDQQRAQNDE